MPLCRHDLRMRKTLLRHTRGSAVCTCRLSRSVAQTKPRCQESLIDDPELRRQAGTKTPGTFVLCKKGLGVFIHRMVTWATAESICLSSSLFAITLAETMIPLSTSTAASKESCRQSSDIDSPNFAQVRWICQPVRHEGVLLVADYRVGKRKPSLRVPLVADAAVNRPSSWR